MPLPAVSRERRTGTEIRRAPATNGAERFLGWFSIGLGITEILAPAAIAGVTGTKKRTGVVRLYGLREIAAGVGILTQRKKANWLWGRVAGDAIDIASIVRGSRAGKRIATACSLAAVAGVTAADIVCAQECTRREASEPDTDRAEASILINSTPGECYRFWHDVENFPRFLPEIRAVRRTGESESEWVVRLPHTSKEAPKEVQWTAEVTEDIPNERISWRSTHKGCTVTGSVEFERAAEDRGTFVRVQVEYGHTGPAFIAPLAALIGKHPNQLTHKALRRLKQLIEVGEILTTEGQPAGGRAGTTWLDDIAR
jgi:uncharacterized membrane protein